MHAALGAITFEGSGGAGTFTIEADGLVGYFEGTDTQGEQIPRTTGDGSFDSPMFLTGKMITIRGWVRTASVSDFEAALALLATIPTQTLTTLTVTTAASVTTAKVRRVGMPQISVQLYGKLARYQVTLWAPDARRYGAAQPTVGPGSSLSVSHAGNWPASPKVTVTGAVSAPYTISDGTHSVTVTQALASGHTHLIDMETGWVYLDGVLQSGVLSAMNVFTIPPATTVTVTGPSSMTVNVTDTYV